MKRLILCCVATVLCWSALAPRLVWACPINSCDPVQCRNSCLANPNSYDGICVKTASTCPHCLCLV